MKITPALTSEIIEMAWDDKAPFEAIFKITGLTEAEVIEIMRKNVKPSSFRMWRKRVSGRTAKHSKKLEYINPIHRGEL